MLFQVSVEDGPRRVRDNRPGAPGPVKWFSPMDLFPIAKTSWSPGDTREVEQSRVRKEIGMEYDSYRRVYIAEGHEWTIAGQIARDDGKKYYILECVK